LRKKIYQLQAKLNLATSADSVNVLSNQSFELAGQGSLDGWEWDDQSNEQISLEQQEGYESMASLRMKTDGESVWMRSNRFAPPKTGRLSITVWIKSVIAEQPPLRLAVEGQTRSSTYYRFGAIGSLAPDSGVNQIDNQWRRFAVHFDDLPAEELIDLRVGFDLMGAGEVLIDNVRVYDRWLDDKDTTAMTQRMDLRAVAGSWRGIGLGFWTSIPNRNRQLLKLKMNLASISVRWNKRLAMKCFRMKSSPALKTVRSMSNRLLISGEPEKTASRALLCSDDGGIA